MNPLLDSEFLIKLNNDKNRTIYAHVISLNQYEHPIEQLEGVVTAGSITIDGQSAVRRVCSLTLSAKNLNINNVYWGLTTKVKIEIGLQNNIIGYEKYGDIIWFPQGIFILTDFKTTQTVNNYTINLTGKDKMCMLNGDVSGNLPAPIRFDSYTDNSNQVCTIGSSGGYNNFIDDNAAAAILEGFQERYGSDYQFIQSAKKILTLQYIPNDISSMGTNMKIQFGPNDNEVKLNTLLTESTQKVNGKTAYDVNLNDNDIYGFIVKNCKQGDQFIWTIEQKIPIPIIIQEMLHQFGQERYSNIIIRNIDPYALEMLDNAFHENYYLLHDGNIYRGFVSQEDLLDEYRLYGKTNADGGNVITTDDSGNINNIIFRNYVEEDDISLVDILAGSTLQKEIVNATKIVHVDDPTIQYTIQPVEEDEVAGYGMTLLVYPDDLIGQPGDSITSILDKIVNMLGDYEYFYDLNGQFIFQAKPAYVKTAWNGTIFLTNENYIEASELVNRVAYTFDDSALTTQYQNTPNMNNIKNDYIIWGEKKNLSGNTVKFHGRYAIENIPLEYTDFNGYTWTSNKTNSLIQAIYETKEEAIKGYKHVYTYPEGYSPEQYGWWEINDWANYYQSIFGVNLAINSSMMGKYHPTFSEDEIKEGINIFNNFFIPNFDKPLSFTTNKKVDVITLTYYDASKAVISNVYSHGGNCTHYYSQFMDLKSLNKGWDYGTVLSEKDHRCSIINIWDLNKKYLLENNKVVSWGYHPDFTTSFIYKPILPNDLSIYSSDIILDIIYTDAKNKNNQKRQYALEEDVDWRHLIYVMAEDWYLHHTEDDYEINLRQNNNWPDLNIDLFPYGRTGYEQYYLDFTSQGGFWQDLYDIYSLRIKYYKTHSELLNSDNPNYTLHTSRYQIATDILDAEQGGNIYLDKYFSSGAYKYWIKDIVKNPENLNFWFDFFKADEMGIGKFAVSVIGDRPKTINDSAIKTIIYRDTPDVIYCTWDEYLYYKQLMVLKDGYKYIIVGNGKSFEPEFLEDEDNYNENKNILTNNIKQNFVRSIRQKTVHDQADDMLYQYSYYNDTVNINNVPVYSLQPNTIISTKDELSRVTGYYVVDKINISLAYNGMMQITAIKSPERIY